MRSNFYLAQAYGGGTYNQSTYQSGTSTGSNTGTTAGGSTSGGALTNTGFDLVVIATLACVIALVALLVRFWKRPAIKKN